VKEISERAVMKESEKQIRVYRMGWCDMDCDFLEISTPIFSFLRDRSVIDCTKLNDRSNVVYARKRMCKRYMEDLNKDAAMNMMIRCDDCKAGV
jgi:hypothetical protein